MGIFEEGNSHVSFFAMLSRMKYINRWGLMRNTRAENICEHSLDVGLIAHALALIGNKKFGKNYDAERAAVLGMLHDASEIITGDMPTPVKYHPKKSAAPTPRWRTGRWTTWSPCCPRNSGRTTRKS